MRFARTVYGIAAAYGVIALLPLYFMAGRIAQEAPPALTHLEFYYGFIGLALLWQAVFVLIARNPSRYRPLMPLTILEKFVYSVPVVILYLMGKVTALILVPSLVDPILGLLFVAAYVLSADRRADCLPAHRNSRGANSRKS